MTNLFTVVNCRQARIEPEAYLNDLIARLPGHQAAPVAEWLPLAWARRRSEAATTATAGSSTDQSR